MKKIAAFIVMITPLFAWGQDQPKQDEQEMGNKEYIIVKDYKPVLSESNKLSEAPSGDTTTFNPPTQSYPFTSRRAEVPYETASINAVKIKDEPLSKLYRCYLKAAGGNYSKYLGELYINSLRSKKGDMGISLKHLSAVPDFKDYNPAGYSTNTGSVNGSYFLPHARLTGDVTYNRQVVHYNGSKDSVGDILKDTSLQRFNTISAFAGIASTYTDSSHVNYAGSLFYSDLKDHYGVAEPEIIVNAGANKKFGAMTYGLNASLAFFTKSDADFQSLTTSSNLARNVMRFNPFIASNREKIQFKAGLRVEAETNEDAAVHVFPQLDFRVPVAEGVLSVFASVDGGIDKNNYHTVTAENAFVNPAVTFKNTLRMADIRAGLSARISDAFSLTGHVGYIRYRDIQYFINDMIRTTTFNLLYDDAGRLYLHGEMVYRATEKLGVSLHFDQFSYKNDVQDKPWYRPSTTVTLKADYNLQNKILVKAALFGVGTRYALQRMPVGMADNVIKLKPYVDANLGVEYRYSKLLSVFFNFNNVGFAQYRQWYDYPVERLNILGGLSYSF